MAIAVVCGSCGKRYEVAEAMAGKRAKCKCGQAIEIALPQPAIAPLDDLLDEALLSAPGLPPSAGKLASLPLPAAQPLAAAPALARRRSKSGGNLRGLLIAGGIGAAVLLLMAIVGGLFYLLFFRTERYATPEAAFKAFREAGVAGNWKRALGVFTPQSQDEMVGMMAFGAVMEAQRDAKVAEILKQHGVDPDQFKQPPTGGGPGGFVGVMAQMNQRKQQLLASIRNKPAFFAAIMSHFEAKKDESAGQFGVDRDALNAEAKLIDLKIDGDTARGKQTASLRGRSIESPIAFRKVDGSWRIDLIALRPNF